jgi:hypothetical protein
MKVVNSILFFGLVTLSLSVRPQGTNGDKFLDKLNSQRINLGTVCNSERGLVWRKVLEEYGSYLVGSYTYGADPVFPSSCIFASKQAVQEYQDDLRNRRRIKSVKIANREFEFLDVAADKLTRVISRLMSEKEIPSHLVPRRNSDCSPTPLAVNGTTFQINEDWANRSYEKTWGNWLSRVDMSHVSTPVRRRATRPIDPRCPELSPAYSITSDAQRRVSIEYVIRKELPVGNTSPIFYGLYGPVMRSVAIPGASQHSLMIAFDMNYTTCDTTGVRDLLNTEGWWETVPGDRCHFTFLGWNDASQMEAHGLRRASYANVIYWIPRLGQFHQFRGKEIELN